MNKYQRELKERSSPKTITSIIVITIFAIAIMAGAMMVFAAIAVSL